MSPTTHFDVPHPFRAQVMGHRPSDDPFTGMPLTLSTQVGLDARRS